MTQPDRQASGGLSATAHAPAREGGTPAHTAPPHPAPALGTATPPRAALWDDVFRAATPDQQQELLSLAGRQGLLYAHQLPRRSNGTPPADDTRGLHLLSHLLAGQTADLHPVRPEPAPCHDEALDRRQRDAVSRALKTPDICLIRGTPGAGKSRVVAEIVTQAAARGDRVLLLAPSGAAIDRALTLLGAREAVCPLRLLAPDERPDRLSPAARAATLPERARALKEDSARAAVAAREDAEKRCQRQRREETLWPRLEEEAAKLTALARQADELTLRRARLPAEVEAEATQAPEEGAPSELRRRLEQASAGHSEGLATLIAAHTEAQTKEADEARRASALRAEVQGLRPAAEAKQHGHWWSPARWRAAFRGDVVGKLAEREAALAAAEIELATLRAAAERVAAERHAAEAAAEEERRRLVAEEVARRQARLDEEGAALGRERAAAAAEWDGLCGQIEAEPCRPAAASAEAVREALARWKAQQKDDEQRCAFARQWASYLETSAEGLAARLPGLANLVAGPAAALPASEHFADPAAAGGQFDLVVFEEADHLTESDLIKLSRRGRRWVLIGDAAEAGEDGPPPAPRRPGQKSGPLARANVFHRLWQTLHCDPSRLPYSWGREQGRLCCRLRQLAPEQRQWLESERVADLPDVELRILALPRVQPLLAEVLFPPAMTVFQAKEYIYRELQELPVLADDGALDWDEDDARLTLVLSRGATAGAEALALEDGLREVVAGFADGGAGGWHTARLEFDRAAGWCRRRAEDWVADHLGLRDLGRTALLERAHRMAAPLAAAVHDLLFGRGPRPAEGATDRPAVEFVSVPPLPRPRDPVRSGGRDSGRRREPGGTAVKAEHRAAEPAFPKAGAGLEQDLAVARHGDRLPNDLRPKLPTRGVVNYLEAQAVVRKLEELAAGGRERGPVAVIAMQPAQAELIRLLARQSSRLSGSGLAVEIDVPAGFRQREFAAVLVSLTRSHSHRAVALSESVGHLALALTRARERLIIFGDAGTLARRSQWHGVLDHHDESAAAREGQVAARLCAYLQGRGRFGRAFRLSEGSGT